MRAVLDTNILISALIAPAGPPAAIYQAWEEKKFTLCTCPEQLVELRATLQKPKVAALIRPHDAGRLVNQIRHLALFFSRLPKLQRSPDPRDDYLLALSTAGQADYLVTGDQRDLLPLRRHGTTRIVSARSFAGICGKLRP